LLDNCKENTIAINFHHLGHHNWSIYGNCTGNQDDEQETNSQLDVVISISPATTASSSGTTGAPLATCFTAMTIALAGANAMPVND
jgi:hypothetical protein